MLSRTWISSLSPSATKGVLVTHVLTHWPSMRTSHVPHSPFLHLYVINCPAWAATSPSGWLRIAMVSSCRVLGPSAASAAAASRAFLEGGRRSNLRQRDFLAGLGLISCSNTTGIVPTSPTASKPWLSVPPSFSASVALFDQSFIEMASPPAPARGPRAAAASAVRPGPQEDKGAKASADAESERRPRIKAHPEAMWTRPGTPVSCWLVDRGADPRPAEADWAVVTVLLEPARGTIVRF
mmetsp:Transcript_14811/g.37084  ORF Transcript_14811/g.37084 Transcript_14811/m.37084 type:complete len:239 (+) Transcript_14811:281-997(+)